MSYVLNGIARMAIAFVLWNVSWLNVAPCVAAEESQVRRSLNRREVERRLELHGVWLEAVPDRGDGGGIDCEAWNERSLKGERLILSGVDLRGADLGRADLRCAKIDDAILNEADLSGARLDGCSVSVSYFIDADMSGVQANHCDFRGVVFSNTTATDGQFRYAKFRGSQMSGMVAERANFFRAEFEDVELRAADLDRAVLEEAIFLDSNLNNARMGRTLMEGVRFGGKEPDGGVFGVSVNGVSFADAVMTRASMIGVDAVEADLANANLQQADLEKARFGSANLTGARLQEANLKRVDFSSADLAGALFHEADLLGAIFEPRRMPTAADLALARNLSWLEWEEDPGQVAALRQLFEEGGFRRQGVFADVALRRGQDGPIGHLLLDWTCEYGSNLLRPVVLALMLAGLLTPFYASAMYSGRGRNGVWVVVKSYKGERSRWKRLAYRGADGGLVAIPWPARRGLGRLARGRPWIHNLVGSLGGHLRIWRAAGGTSLRAAFGLPMGHLKFSQWSRLLLTREYDFVARGWPRMLVGFQSLVSLALLLLVILTLLKAQPL